MKHFKLRKDLIMEWRDERKLFRIEATRNLDELGVKKGDLGGWVEKYANLGGNAWIFDEAKV